MTPKPPAGSGLQMQSSFGGGGGQAHFAGGSPKRKGKTAAKKTPKKKAAAKPAKPKPQKASPAAPKLTVAQKKRLAAKGSITVKRNAKFVTITR